MIKNWTECLIETVNKYPDCRAVSDETASLTYKELLKKAEICAAYIRGDIEGNPPVVLLMDKSITALVCLYGVIFAGAFYVFVSPDQPKARIRKILEDLQPAGIIYEEATEEVAEELSSQKIFQGFSLKGEEIIKEDGKGLALLESFKEAEKEKKAAKSPDDILYGVYTSGSTGNPKGIVVSHRAACQFIGHFTETFQIGADDRLGNQAPFDFDVSIKDIFSACMTGAELVIIPRRLFSVPAELMDYLVDRKITSLVWAVSAMCMLSVFGGFDYKVPKSLKRVMFSGEVMPPKQLRIWQAKLPDTDFVNLYGPSEITCNCSYFRVDRQYGDGEKIPIGRAFEGRILLLEDREGKEIREAGRVGELLVGGESLSEGYYKNPEMTRDKFVYRKGDMRFYKTGDLAHYDEEGLLLFDGRADFQIKHMGHRIELEEIEASILRLEEVTRACCLFDEKKGRIIAVYTGQIKAGQCRSALKEFLPRYMIPNKFQQIEAFVLNKNGKIDKAYLKESLGIV